MSVSFVRATQAPDGYDTIITVLHRPCWLLRLLGAKSGLHQYRGSCGMWHSYPDGKSCTAGFSCWLIDRQYEWKWSKESEPHESASQ